MQRSFRSRESGRTRFAVPAPGESEPLLTRTDYAGFHHRDHHFRKQFLTAPPLFSANETQLPMSFIASFLAIGIKEFPKDEGSDETDWPLNTVASYLCECLQYPFPWHHDQPAVL